MCDFAALLLAALFLVSGAANTRAEDEPVFTIEFKDGNIIPERLEVPANRRFQLQLRNNGDPPAEFESSELRKEKVLAPKSTAILVFRTLDPGESKKAAMKTGLLMPLQMPWRNFHAPHFAIRTAFGASG